MKQLITLALSVFALSTAGFAQTGNTRVTPVTPTSPISKNCDQFKNVTWEALVGMNLPKSFPSPEASCKEVLAKFPDAGNMPIWSLPYVRLGVECGVIVGDRQPNGQYNQQAQGNTLRLNEDASRAEVVAFTGRLIAAMFSGKCGVSREEFGVILVAVTGNKQALEELSAALATLQSDQRESLVMLVAFMKETKDASGRLTTLAGRLEVFLIEGYVLRPDLSSATKLVFVNLQGKRYEVVLNANTAAVAQPQRSLETVINLTVSEGVKALNCAAGADNLGIPDSGERYVLKFKGQVVAVTISYYHPMDKKQRFCTRYEGQFDFGKFGISGTNYIANYGALNIPDFVTGEGTWEAGRNGVAKWLVLPDTKSGDYEFSRIK